MFPLGALQREPWYLGGRFRRVALAILALAVVVEGVIAIGFRENDFAVHLDFGRQFLVGDAYRHPEPPYPLGRLIFDAALARLDYRVARAVTYIAAVLALGGTLVLWNRLAQHTQPLSPRAGFAAAALSLFLLYPYVIRDLDDCGLQFLLLGMLTIGFSALMAGRDFPAGAWFAAAASYKLTPLLVLPFLLWKRRWTAALAMAVGLVAINFALPIAIVGWDSSRGMQQRWVRQLAACGAIRDPSRNGVEPARHQNQCLPMAIARYVQTYPPGDDLYLDHPGYVHFAALGGEEARRVVTAVLGGLALVLAWRFRRSWNRAEPEADAPREWAAVLILCALLSQLCWLQHLVLMLPAVFLLIRDQVALREAGRPASRGVVGVLATVGIIVLLLQRDIVQRDLSILVLSYKLDTLAALVAMAAVLIRRPASIPAAGAVAQSAKRRAA